MLRRAAYPAFLLANALALLALARADALSAGSVLALHFANIAALFALELATPLNPRWLMVRRGRVRWRLLAKTWAWYLVNSRVWFPLHGLAVGALAAWIAARASWDASTLPWPAQLLGFALVVDLARYGIHRAAHASPLLWRFHAMHHAPTNMTSVRAWWTHPVDDVLLYSLEIVLLVALRLDPLVVLAYASLDNAFQLLNHANVRLDGGPLAWLLQHPRTHLLHHRVLEEGQRAANFGEMFTIWDRVFGTFEAWPDDALRELEIGLGGGSRALGELLLAPFTRRGLRS